MVETTTKSLEREYIIPLKKSYLKVARYKRTSKAIKTIKQFIAKHMKVEDRDVSKVKLDPYFNNDIWFRGKTNPPTKVKVKAVKEGGIVKVDFVEIPDRVKFAKARHDKFHKETGKKPEIKPEEEKPDTLNNLKVVKGTSEKTEDALKGTSERKEETEKEQAVAQQREKQAQQKANVEKHTVKGKAPQIRRLAMKK